MGRKAASQVSIAENTLHLEGGNMHQINNYLLTAETQTMHKYSPSINSFRPSYLLTLRFLRLPSSFLESPAAETGAVSVFFLSSAVEASVFLVDYMDYTISPRTKKKKRITDLSNNRFL